MDQQGCFKRLVRRVLEALGVFTRVDPKPDRELRAGDGLRETGRAPRCL